MTITGAFVLFAVTWFMTLFVVLPIGVRTHGDDGVNTSEKPAYAPANLDLGTKLRRVTLITIAIWLPICAVIMSGVISISDIDLRGTLQQ